VWAALSDALRQVLVSMKLSAQAQFNMRTWYKYRIMLNVDFYPG
jgi:hypothetical protein